MSDNHKEKWDTLYAEAQEACRKAQVAVNDLAGWSGSSGNCPLQEASTILLIIMKTFALRTEDYKVANEVLDLLDRKK